MSSKWERWSALAGALAVPFWVAGVIIISTQATGSKGPKILASYHDHSNAILLGGFLWSLGVVLFIWFLGALRTHFAEAEGGNNRLTALAYGGGLAAAAIAMLIPAVDEVGALNKNDLDPSSAAALHHLSDAFFIATAFEPPWQISATPSTPSKGAPPCSA